MTESDQRVQALFKNADMESPETLHLPGGEAVVFSASHPEKERPNEDTAAVLQCSNSASVLAVADGMGGQKAGNQASHVAVTSLKKSMEQPPSEEFMLRTAVLDGIEEASRQVMGLGVGAGTTIAAVEIQDGSVRPYHVGDSMILVVGQRGRIKLLTVAHSPVAMAVQAGMMDEHEAMHHEERHLVLNFVGSTEMRIEIGPVIELAPRDTVLLASDGLFDNLAVEEMVAQIRKGSLEKGVAAIAAEARRRMTAPEPGHPSKPDDLTLIAYRRRHKGKTE